MARKLIAKYGGAGVEARMYKDADYGEYVVVLYIDGVKTPNTSDAGYFTDDKADAKATAEDMVKRTQAKLGR